MTHFPLFPKVVDACAVGVIAGTIADKLPAASALFSLIWFALQIWAFFKDGKHKSKPPGDADGTH